MKNEIWYRMNTSWTRKWWVFSPFSSPDGQLQHFFPPEHVQELNLGSTGICSSAIQKIFAYHMIETYGCDYSTSGLSFDTLHSKLKAFLELRTVDGPRHDAYVLYYSGHTHGTGEWALAGKSTSGNFTIVQIHVLVEICPSHWNNVSRFSIFHFIVYQVYIWLFCLPFLWHACLA